MKLLLYSHFFAPSVGGVETIVLSLARGLVELRAAGGESEFAVTLVTQTPAGHFDDPALGFKVARRPSLLRLWRLIRRADVVHVAGPALAPLALAWMARRPVVVEHHGYQAICPNGLLLHEPDKSVCPGHFQAGRYWRCVACNASQGSLWRSVKDLVLTFPRHFLSRRAAVNIGITNHVVGRLALPRSKTCYYGIEGAWRNSSSSVTAKPAREKVCFAYVGRLVAEKGLPLLIEAARRLKKEGFEFDLRFVGDGPERPLLESLRERHELGLVVQITGFLSGDALRECLRSVHVVVMPSIWEETAGLAAMEQMMGGRLVIAAEIGGLGEVVGEGGLKFPPKDVDGLTERMRRILKEPNLLVGYGEKARARAVELFQRERMISDHAVLYRAVRGGLHF